MGRSEAHAWARGFTLLEVLVAVAVLGLLYTTLAGVTIQGLRAEGESARRLEASLLVDERLAVLEVGLRSGAPPPIGREEEEVEGFLVVTEVSAYDLPLALERPEGLERGPTLFGTRGRESLMRRVDVQVSWMEGTEERSVRRTSFGLDLEEAAQLLEGLAPGEGVDTGDEGNAPTRDGEEGDAA